MLTVTNPASAGDVNVHGFRLYFRNKTTLTAAVSAGATSLPVANGTWFKAGDVLLLGPNGSTEEVTVSAVAGNTLTVGATTGAFALGDPVRRKDFWHMGHVRNPERTQEREVQEIFSAIDGKSQKIKEIVTSVTKGLSFESISGADPLVKALHTGNPSLSGVIADTTVFTDDVNAVDGEVLIVQPNAETGGIAYVEFKPTAQISGDGFAQGSDGENEDALSFTCSFNADSGYTVPAALATTEPAAPLGVIVKTAPASLDAVVNVFADATA